MQVQEIMTRHVITVRSSNKVTAVVRLFREHNISGMPVVDDEDNLVGMVTEMDLIARHARPHFPNYIAFLDSIIYLGSTKRYHESMRHILATTAAEIMTEQVATVSPETDVLDLAELMVESGANPVAVVDAEKHLVGIVSHTDLLKMIEQAEAAAA
jgi:CBS-domain-containing membrane protein